MPNLNVGFLVAAALLCAPAARGATCDPGYWLYNGECAKCTRTYYCPGDDARHLCPATDVDPDHVISYNSYSDDGIYRYQSLCRAMWKYDTFQVSCMYGVNGYTGHDPENTTKCMVDVFTCAAGYMCPWCNASGRYWIQDYHAAMAHERCTPAELGYYSPDGDVGRTACPAGMSTHTRTAASVDECDTLCPGGVSKIRTPRVFVPLWKKATTSKSLAVKINGTVCYGNLAAGAATGAINIRMDTGDYHLVY